MRGLADLEAVVMDVTSSTAFCLTGYALLVAVTAPWLLARVAGGGYAHGWASSPGCSPSPPSLGPPRWR
jgi:hypothetical protein